MLKSTFRRAFTLVEMLVILAIVALLSALLFTAFSSVREGGRRTVCLSNERQIYAAFQLYLNDSGGLHPKDSPLNGGTWLDGIAPLVASTEVFHCPSDTDWSSREKQRDSPIIPKPKKEVPSSYIVNSEGLTREFFGKVTVFSGLVEKPSSTVLLSDGANQAYKEPPYVVPFYEDIGVYQSNAGNLLSDPANAGKEINGCCGGTCNCIALFAPAARHNGRANVLFFDGHVKSMENSQWYFPNTPYLDPARGG